MEKLIKKYLLLIARKYARKKELALTTVSRQFHGKETFFDDFAHGKRSITLRKADEMICEFQARWPADLTWPDPTEYLRQQTIPK